MQDAKNCLKLTSIAQLFYLNILFKLIQRF